MFATGLEFAAGTTDDCKRLVQRLLKPEDLLGAYRMAREKFKTGDLVLTISERDPSGFEAEPRLAYAKRLRQAMGHRAHMAPTILDKSAHSVTKLPFESEAMWLVIVRGTQTMPVMCVVFATPYKSEPAPLFS